MNMILSWVILSVRFLLLMVYLIFWQVFKTAFSDFKYALFPSLVPQSDFVAYTMPEISTPSDKMVNVVILSPARQKH